PGLSRARDVAASVKGAGAGGQDPKRRTGSGRGLRGTGLAAPVPLASQASNAPRHGPHRWSVGRPVAGSVGQLGGAVPQRSSRRERSAPIFAPQRSQWTVRVITTAVPCPPAAWAFGAAAGRPAG